MDEEVIDAPVPDETEVAEAAEEVVEEQKGEEPLESSPDTQEDPAQKRIDELTKKRRTAEREADYWRNQAIQNAPQPEAPPEPEPLKTLEDFDYDEGKFQSHLFQQAQNGAVEQARRVLKEEQMQEASRRTISEYKKRIDSFSKTVDDFNEVAQNDSLPISTVMADVIVEMEQGPEVLYYLGKNSDIAEKIAGLSPLSAARELGRIESKLQVKNGEKVSKAPVPPPKISATEPAITKSLDELEGKAYNDKRRAYINSHRRG